MTNPLPLSDIKILEVGNALAVPLATRFLADMGAEVIKVESLQRPEVGRGITHPEGKPGAKAWETGGFYQEANRNKSGITLNLNTADGRTVLSKLVAECDVVGGKLRTTRYVELGHRLRVVAPVQGRCDLSVVVGIWTDRAVEGVQGLRHDARADGGALTLHGVCRQCPGQKCHLVHRFARSHDERLRHHVRDRVPLRHRERPEDRILSV